MKCFPHKIKWLRFRYTTVIGVLLLIGGCALWKDTSTKIAMPISPGIENLQPAAVSKFTLGPGDTVEINVWRGEDLNRKILIGPTGIISYPFVGDIQANGKSTFQLRNIITETLSEYFKDVQVTVNLVSNQSKKIFVLGEVKRPGMFSMAGPITILEAVSMANGFTHDAKKKTILLVRGSLDKPELKSINLNAVLKEGDINQNVSLEPGDVVYVPTVAFARAENFFKRIYNIIAPIVSLEYGLAIAPMVEDTLNTSGKEGISIQLPSAIP